MVAFREGRVDEPPSYSQIDGQPLNRAITQLFRRKMVAELGTDSKLEGYAAIIDLTRLLNSRSSDPRETQIATRRILRSLFPSWLPSLFKVMFAKPMPTLSNVMNAWVTSLTCQWLMGPNTVNDVEIDGGKLAKAHGVKVERCRYLEEAGCVSVCVNSCKVPTQEFFKKDMGMDVTLEPNYDDYSCQFVFGKTPPPQTQDDAFQSPCFARCPSRKVSKESGECHGLAPSDR